MLVKAFLTLKDDPTNIVPCLFNPNELTVEKSNHFAEVNIPGLETPILQFVRGNARVVTMDLFFDTYEEKTDVRLFTDRITGWDAGSMFSDLPDIAKGLMNMDSELHAPPVCLFIWGTFLFQCVIQSTTKRFTMFLPAGIPVRATLRVTLKEYTEVETEILELDLHSSDLIKTRVVKEGDSLWAMAAKEYGGPQHWRLIAEANDIDNPRLLQTGRELMIPIKE